MEYRLLSFKDYIDNVDYIYAHKKLEGDNIKYETLEEHSKLCIKYFSEIDKEKNIINKVLKIIKEIFKELEWEEDSEKLQFVADMFVNSIYLHDIGKSNPYFQIYNMDNKRFKVSGSVDKCHSMLSALIFADIYRKKLKDKNDNDWSKLEYFVYIFSFIISRHHSYLNDGMSESKFIEGFKQIKEYEPDLLLNYKEEINGKITKNNFIKSFTKFRSLKAYTLSKLLYSVLINCDFAATQEYMRGKKVDIIYSFDKQELINKYENQELIKNIRGGKKAEGINYYRTEIFKESEKNLKENMDKSIFYLEAPTGSGKTNTSLNLAFNFLRQSGINNIFYIFPFNTLAEQTAQSISKFAKDEYKVINSTTPILINNNSDENIEYEKIYFDYQTANYPITVSSHVRLFRALFGNGREDNLWFYRLANSVIILDEIQSYRNSIWSNFINLMKDIAYLLDIKLIIMSATLPKLHKLIDGDFSSEICYLIEAEKYYQNEYFKNRVECDFSLLDKKLDLEELKDKVVEIIKANRDKKILIEFIKKKTARKFYDMLKEALNEDNIAVEEISGDDNKFKRKEILNKIKNNEINVVVATQVIEAGIDIDMDIGFKDISVTDSEEQFLGRINRSATKKGCKAYFFDFDDEKQVYKNDKRLEYTIRDENIRNIVGKTKRFDDFYINILNGLKADQESTNNKISIDAFKANVARLDYEAVEKSLRPIESNTYQIVLNYDYEYNGEKYNGGEIWQTYKNILANRTENYGEFMINLSEIKEKLSMFTFTMYGRAKEGEMRNAENIGELFYFDDGYDYITEEGKFDREKFENEKIGENLFV